MPKKLTTEQFVAKAREIHGDKYDYSKVVYTKMHDYITITCPNMAISCRKHIAILMVRVVASAQKKNQGLNSFSELPTTIATEIATQTLIVIGETCSLDVLMKNTRKKALHTQTVRVATNGYFLATLSVGTKVLTIQIIILIKIFLSKTTKSILQRPVA